LQWLHPIDHLHYPRNSASTRKNILM
jgi:hypothetical protein